MMRTKITLITGEEIVANIRINDFLEEISNDANAIFSGYINTGPGVYVMNSHIVKVEEVK